MDKGKEAVIDKLYSNTMKIYSFLNLINKPNNNSSRISNSNNNSQKKGIAFNSTEAICSLVIYFFSNFKYKLQLSALTSKNEDNIIAFLNQILKMSNCKFLITKSITKAEVITITLYLIHEYDILSSFLSYLKAFESRHLNVSFNSIAKVVSFNSSNQNLSSDTLASSPSSQSTIEAFNKLNFVLKNIKKQIDLFVNLTYKVSELKKRQDKPISSLKIEEIIVVSDKVFSFYYESFKMTKETILYHLEDYPSLIDTVNQSYELYQNSHMLFSVDNINPSYDENNKNSKLETIKQLFRIKILLEGQGNNNHNIMLRLTHWIQKMDDALSSNLSLLKQANPHLFNNDNVTKTLETIAGELENFIEANEKSIHKLMSNFEKDSSNDYTLIKMLASSNKESLEEIYDNYLIINDGLEELYNYHLDSINDEVKSYTIDINKKYNIMNSTP